MDQVIQCIGLVFASYWLLLRKSWLVFILGVIISTFVLLYFFAFVGFYTAAAFIGGSFPIFMRRYDAMKSARNEGRSHEGEPNQDNSRGKDKSSVG